MDISRAKRIWIWISRCTHSLGFGVQSPNDYRYICDVVNQHYPYYAYESLRVIYPDLSSVMRKLYELYFRMINDRQPSLIVDYRPDCNASGAYMQAGCHSAQYTKINSVQDFPDSSLASFIRLTFDSDAPSAIRSLLNKINDKSVLVLEGIYKNNTSKRLWKEIIINKKTTVTFDLYFCGIIFFDKKRYKQNYIVNF